MNRFRRRLAELIAGGHQPVTAHPGASIAVIDRRNGGPRCRYCERPLRVSADFTWELDLMGVEV